MISIPVSRPAIATAFTLALVAGSGCFIEADDPAEPPAAPASFDEVGPAMARLREPTVAAAQGAIDDLRNGRFVAAHARFGTMLAGASSAADLEAAWEAVLAAAPVGGLLGDRFVAAARSNGNSYAAEYAWGDAPLQFRVEVDGAGRIVFFEFSAAADVLPLDQSATTRHQLRPPFEGVWLVSEGPATEVLNHHSVEPSQRHASDVVVWRDGSTFRGDGLENEDYYAWRQRVLSPAAGTVAFVFDGQDDIAPDPNADLDPNDHPAGNHVVIALGGGEFALLAHMMKGSIVVRLGDDVSPGQFLGRVGNSGSTTEPHIHFHIQDRADFFESTVGFKAPFANYLLDGKRELLSEPGSPVFVQFAP